MDDLDPDLVAFTQSSFRSLWAVEMMFLLMRNSPNAVSRDDAVRELRANRTLVQNCIEQLSRAGLLQAEGDAVRYAPGSAKLDELARKLEQAYRERPLAVIRAVVHGGASGIQHFADAFRFKEPKE
jgi:hypothetical protein